MAYPKLLQRLFKNSGAGPELKEEIVPHELTNGLTAPSYSVTGGGGLLRNVVNRTNPTGELVVRNEVRMDTIAGDDGAYIVLREQTGNGDDAPAGSIYMRSCDDSENCEVHITPKSVDVSKPIYCHERVTASGFISADGGVTVSAEAGDIIAARATNSSTGNDIWFGVGGSGSNRGIYDQRLDKWMLYATNDDIVHSAFPLVIDGKAGNDSIKANGDIVSINGWMYAGCFKATSDRRLKSDLEPKHYDLSSITAYRYTLKSDKQKHVGLIAQEVEEVIPEAVSADKDGVLSLDYNAVVAALVAEVNALKRRCDSLESEKVSLRAAVENLAGQKKSLERICSLLTRGQDILRNENDVAMDEVNRLKLRVAALEGSTK